MQEPTSLYTGVDVGKDELYVCLLARVPTAPSAPPHTRTVSRRKFDNTPGGHAAFVMWLRAHERNLDAPGARVAMEASGVYFEAFAHAVHAAGLTVCVLLANTVKHFGLSLNEHSKTDRIDALVIARLACERALATWTPYSPMSRQLKLLNREREAIIHERTMVKNRQHSAVRAQFVSPETLARYEARIAFLDGQVAAIAAEAEGLLAADEKLAAAVGFLETIPGIGRTTAVALVAETDAFALFESRGQLIKYCGYDVVSHQSGTSINAPTRISKKGNHFIRKALHFPAMQARKKGIFAEVYQRQFERSGSKMSALVAVQRKLLIVAYALIKNECAYVNDHHKGAAADLADVKRLPELAHAA